MLVTKIVSTAVPKNRPQVYFSNPGAPLLQTAIISKIIVICLYENAPNVPS